MATDEIRGDRVYTGDVTFVGLVNLPLETIEDEDINPGANISTQKMIHRHLVQYGQADGAEVASATQLVHVARADGEVLSVEVRVSAAPAGGDKQYTVDVQRAADGSGSWTSVLNAAITVDAAAGDDTLIAGVIPADTTYEDGDALRVVVTASGSTGDQGQGLVVTINLNEDPS